MDEQRVRGGGPPRWWRPGRPWLGRWEDEERGPRWPWRSTVPVTVFVLVGSNFAAHQQAGERAGLDAFARVLLLVASGLLLWRRRYPVFVLFGTAAAVMLYLGAGFPYGPVFLTVALACFSALVAGSHPAPPRGRTTGI